MSKERSQELLFEYAAGVLDDARRFMIDAHLQMSEHGRASVRVCEEVGGYLLVKDCAVASMNPTARDRMMDMIDHALHQDAAMQAEEAQVAKQCMQTVDMLKALGLSGALVDHLEESCRHACHTKKWSGWNARIRYFDVDTGCSASRMRLVRIDAGTEIPPHSHRGEEMTLLLRGTMRDEYGVYGPGDLIIRHDGEIHSPIIGDDEDCVCLALTYRPLKMKCMVRRVFNIFYRF